MTLEGLLAVAGIVIAVYAVAQPVQRRSIGLFVPTWLVPGSLVISAGIALWRAGADIFGYKFFPWSDFILILMSFSLPVMAILSGIRLWSVARLTKRKDNRFREFVLASLYEGQFDELLRIIERNIGQLGYSGWLGGNKKKYEFIKQKYENSISK